MKAAELKVVEEAKRSAHSQFSHYYKVMGGQDSRSSQAGVQTDKKKSEPDKQNKK